MRRHLEGSPADEICTDAAKNIVYPINADHARFGYYRRRLRSVGASLKCC